MLIKTATGAPGTWESVADGISAIFLRKPLSGKFRLLSQTISINLHGMMLMTGALGTLSAQGRFADGILAINAPKEPNSRFIFNVFQENSWR